MPNDDLFNGAGQTQAPQVDPNKNYLEELVGEGKKFKSVDELARGKAEADTFISKLQGELEGLRQELTQRARLGDLVDQLANTAKPKPEEPAHQSTPTGQGETLDAAKIQQMVDDLLAQRAQQSTASQNLNTVKQRLAEEFGPGYADKLTAKANELGLSKEALNDLAAKSPQAFFTLVGVGAQKTTSTNGFVPPASSQSKPSSNGSVDRTKAFYDNLKKANPVQYWDKHTQQQMHKDAIRLGAAFFDN